MFPWTESNEEIAPQSGQSVSTGTFPFPIESTLIRSCATSALQSGHLE